jgi:hypothetical protein
LRGQPRGCAIAWWRGKLKRLLRASSRLCCYRPMRRYVQILGLVVLAFAASGWGSIVAAALCPHATLTAARTMTVQEEAGQSCHSAKPETRTELDCHDGSVTEHESAAKAEAPPAVPGSAYGDAAFGQTDNTPCTHCLGRPELPASTVVAVRTVEQKRGLEPAPVQTASPAMLPALAFTRPVLYRQGAPPGSTTPKHLLISVLLI